MIAVDTSSWIAFFSDRDSPGDDTALVESALADHQACLPPVVLTELLSDPKLPRALASLFLQLPLLESEPGFWERAGRLRAKLVTRRRRARLADTLIAQSCLDHGVRLVTRDDDFRHYARLGGLRLAL
ncbi:MAG: PIN domain-containing protein [Deltaproteobacteria bacterium]|nr:PIN domain-containing protein [Deltaproteobacteria bacterium]